MLLSEFEGALHDAKNIKEKTPYNTITRIKEDYIALKIDPEYEKSIIQQVDNSLNKYSLRFLKTVLPVYCDIVGKRSLKSRELRIKNIFKLAMVTYHNVYLPILENLTGIKRKPTFGSISISEMLDRYEKEFSKLTGNEPKSEIKDKLSVYLNLVDGQQSNIAFIENENKWTIIIVYTMNKSGKSPVLIPLCSCHYDGQDCRFIRFVKSANDSPNSSVGIATQITPEGSEEMMIEDFFPSFEVDIDTQTN